jgi:hypothetical protein
MALWEVSNGIKKVLMHSEGALSFSNPPSYLAVKRFRYKVPYSNVGVGGFLEKDGKKYHTPSWIEVHSKTTIEDIMVEKKPFEELFVEEKTWDFKSSSSDKTYIVRYNKSGNLSCNCWGYMAHKRCKHIKEVQSWDI